MTYEGGPDPYCYAGSAILKNRLNLRLQADLGAFEALITAQRGDEPLPTGRLGVAHYRAIHRHLFQDVYGWADNFRTTRIAKGGSMFCYPEHVPAQMARSFEGLRAERFLRGVARAQFAGNAAHFLAELNAFHPFREGNGRAQLTFLALLAAMVASFNAKEAPLAALIGELVD